jgi:hypothetical protein
VVTEIYTDQSIRLKYSGGKNELFSYLHLIEEMVLQILHHSERAETLHAKHSEELVVADGKLLVLRILKTIICMN